MLTVWAGDEAPSGSAGVYKGVGRQPAGTVRSRDGLPFVLRLGSSVQPAALQSRANDQAPTPLLPAALLRQTVESHLRRLGAAHVEGCGDWEDHHMFSLEEVQVSPGLAGWLAGGVVRDSPGWGCEASLAVVRV